VPLETQSLGVPNVNVGIGFNLQEHQWRRFLVAYARLEETFENMNAEYAGGFEIFLNSYPPHAASCKATEPPPTGRDAILSNHRRQLRRFPRALRGRRTVPSAVPAEGIWGLLEVRPTGTWVPAAATIPSAPAVGQMTTSLSCREVSGDRRSSAK
jgi:hypothetical protein